MRVETVSTMEGRLRLREDAFAHLEERSRVVLFLLRSRGRLLTKSGIGRLPFLILCLFDLVEFVLADESGGDRARRLEGETRHLGWNVVGMSRKGWRTRGMP